MSGLVKSIVRNVRNTGRISFLQRQIEVQIEENEKLQRHVDYRYSTEYLEKEARDRLGMVKENEVLLLLPDVGNLNSILGAKTEVEKVLPINVPIWQQWRFIFLGY